MPIYNKLVRDGIPAIINSENRNYRMQHIMDTEQHALEIKRKFVEELKEYQEDSTHEEAVEELVDLLELIYAVLPLHGSSM